MEDQVDPAEIGRHEAERTMSDDSGGHHENVEGSKIPWLPLAPRVRLPGQTRGTCGNSCMRPDNPPRQSTAGGRREGTTSTDAGKVRSSPCR